MFHQGSFSCQIIVKSVNCMMYLTTSGFCFTDAGMVIEKDEDNNIVGTEITIKCAGGRCSNPAVGLLTALTVIMSHNVDEENTEDPLTVCGPVAELPLNHLAIIVHVFKSE